MHISAKSRKLERTPCTGTDLGLWASALAFHHWFAVVSNSVYTCYFYLLLVSCVEVQRHICCCIAR